MRCAQSCPQRDTLLSKPCLDRTKVAMPNLWGIGYVADLLTLIFATSTTCIQV